MHYDEESLWFRSSLDSDGFFEENQRIIGDFYEDTV